VEITSIIHIDWPYFKIGTVQDRVNKTGSQIKGISKILTNLILKAGQAFTKRRVELVLKLKISTIDIALNLIAIGD